MSLLYLIIFRSWICFWSLRCGVANSVYHLYVLSKIISDSLNSCPAIIYHLITTQITIIYFELPHKSTFSVFCKFFYLMYLFIIFKLKCLTGNVMKLLLEYYKRDNTLLLFVSVFWIEIQKFPVDGKIILVQ